MAALVAGMVSLGHLCSLTRELYRRWSRPLVPVVHRLNCPEAADRGWFDTGGSIPALLSLRLSGSLPTAYQERR